MFSKFFKKRSKNKLTTQKNRALNEEGVSKIYKSQPSTIAIVIGIFQEQLSGNADKGLTELETWKTLLKMPEQTQMDVAVFCGLQSAPKQIIGHGKWVALQHDGYSSSHQIESYISFTQYDVVARLLKRNLPYTEKHLVPLIDNTVGSRYYTNYYLLIPASPLLKTIERYCETNSLSSKMTKRLQDWTRKCDGTQASFKKTDRINAILRKDSGAEASLFHPGPWGECVLTWLPQQTEKRQAAWRDLFLFAATAHNKSKPSKKWLKDCKPLVSAIGRPIFAKQMAQWFLEIKPDPERPDRSLEVFKGLIWACHHTDAKVSALALGGFTEVCMYKIRGIGARSKKLANACLLTLADMSPPEHGISELVRLKAKIKYPSVRDYIGRTLDVAAKKAGIGLDELQESALPDFGMDGGGISETMLGEVKAIIKLEPDGAKLFWRGADGKPRKAPPVSVKRDFKSELAALKKRAKDITAAQKAQTILLENSWLNYRSWTYAKWVQNYLEHPLRRPLSRTLIWQVVGEKRTIAFMQSGTKFVDVEGATVKLSDTDTIHLWHPLNSPTKEVLAWRQYILAQEMTQPIKQAYREIYVLTDAERNTDIYSNRFAAHILRQHQFKALCQARHWDYQLQGWFDSWNEPTRTIKQRDIRIIFQVTMVEETADRDRSGIASHLTTDQVRFETIDRSEIHLRDVPPIVFSELLRDVDLFVAVTSVANDPNWTDGGPNGRFGGYWSEQAFGNLNETAKTRQALLVDLVPKLALAKQLQVTDRYLNVQGKHGQYRIHLGSGNIQIMPQQQYLCIVPTGGKRKTDQINLPFTGDGLLSIILSKAFLLAADDKITDKTILSQLQR